MQRRERSDIEQPLRGGRSLLKRMLILLGLASAAAMLVALSRARPEGRGVDARVRQELREVASRKAATAAGPDGAEPGQKKADEVSPSGDDLKVIEGIGPRIEEVLQAAGVRTYAGLAELRPGRLQTIMREAGKRMAKPDTWPEQARLAAAGEWVALKDLQDSVKRGVPVS